MLCHSAASLVTLENGIFITYVKKKFHGQLSIAFELMPFWCIVSARVDRIKLV